MNVNEQLPEEGVAVLGISKFGHISSMVLRPVWGRLMFTPGGYKIGTDVKWWAPIPEDGWHELSEKPEETGKFFLTKNVHGDIASQRWSRCTYFDEKQFKPFPLGFSNGVLKYWREIPGPLPDGITLQVGTRGG